MVLLDWPPPDHLGIGRKSRQFLPAQASCGDPGTGANIVLFPSRLAQNGYMLSAKHRRRKMSTNDTAINIIDGLKGQHAQLRRLLAQRMWINEASKATLAELENQIAQIKTVLLELEKDIQDQLKRAQ
jgi:hypothetical protein